jgi:5-(carboxyamino)imidazole ribonucleotide mutase
MPAGIPVGTLAIGRPGAANAALLAAQVLANHDPALVARLEARRAEKAADALARPLPAPGAIVPTEAIHGE